MNTEDKILLIDDEEGLRYGLKTYLSRKGFQVYDGENRSDAVKLLKTHLFGIAILDIRLKNEENGLDIIDLLRDKNPDIIILIVTGFAHLDTAVAAIRKGANDYLEKPLENERVLDSIIKNSEISKLRKENHLLKNELKNTTLPGRIITESHKIKEILRNADKVKNLAPNILITGESGTGKEILARYIHYSGNRKDNLFVGLNSAAFSDSLLLSELFGHRKGAFTGAVDNKTGKLEMAHKGTFFLDEVGDMNLDIQAKFLRVLEERTFEPLGGNNTINVDIHIIAATNKNLTEMIAQGKFREDLFYRLNVINFHLPPLRERKEDLEGLCFNFIDFFNRQYRKNIQPLSGRVLHTLNRHNWPGNIRELKNVINQAVLLADRDIITDESIRSLIGSKDLPLNSKPSEGEDLLPQLLNAGTLQERLAPLTQFYEKKLLLESMSKNKNNKTKTAEELGLSRKTIARKLQYYDIHL